MLPSTVKTFIAALAAVAIPVSANNPIKWNDFWDNGGKTAAMAAVPMYHFGRPRGEAPCYPEDAEYNGVQVDGVSHLTGGVYCQNLNMGCRWPGEWTGRNSAGVPFPIYYTIRECNGRVRVAYSIYFKKDTGHKSDWENVIVEWNGDGKGGWIRESIFLGQHSYWEKMGWGSIQNTVDGEWDKYDQDAKNRDHPKVYVGAFKHATFHTRRTVIDSCAFADKDEFRSNDWQLLPWSDLVKNGDVIKDGWDWGAANTNPATLRGSLCSK
ncbi:hypothetical protein QBC34DRAFT_356328 [Podospora aff. communis PSN243]|uniref:Uncharacterized protein n=1 Tax=Podospora aff. communis PSN243 TaxID=3040156 RepID=A0AAV9GI63_9PEZI|nr:hypothetical protein QBC34DRAFT_356328 [Podospora aff. communis PSN243]